MEESIEAMGPSLVSVLMTCYNRQAFITEAIESVLNSTYQNFELIIVDDASTDQTVSIAKEFALRDQRIKVYVNDQNLGDYPNRNKAASYAKGKYIKYVDSDDRINPEGLKVMVEAMEQYPEAAFGFCAAKEDRYANYPVIYTGAEALRKHFFGGGLLQAGPSTTIIRLDAFKKIGGFSGKRYISDYEAWLQFCLSFPVLILPPNLVWIRNHAGQENDAGQLAYYHLNYNLHKNFIQNTDNSFTKTERNKLLYNYRILLGRRAIQRLVKWFGLRKTLQTIRAAGESPAIFLWALMPMKK